MQYRTADLNDLDAVVELVLELARSQDDYGSRIELTTSTETLRSRLAQQLVDGRVIVADAEPAVVGVVTFSIATSELARRETVGIIEYLYVERSHRNAGIGTDLLRRAEQALAERGATVVDLEVLSDNELARQFYEARGYTPHRYRLTRELEGS